MKRFNRLISTIILAIMLATASYSFAAGPVKIVDATGTATTNVANVTGNALSVAIVAGGGSSFVVDKGYLNQIREGNIAGHEYVRIQGNNLSLSTALEEISDLGTVGFGAWVAVASPLGVVMTGDSAADDVAGTGALTVTVRGLDVNFVAAEETETTAGVGAMTITTQTFIRINEIEVATAGTGLTNAGNITASIDGADIISLVPNHSKSKSGRYTVPAGKTLYLQNPEGSVIGTKYCAFHVYTRNTQVANSPFVLQRIWQSEDGGYNPNGYLMAITEKHDVILLGDAGALGSIVAASVEGWIE